MSNLLRLALVIVVVLLVPVLPFLVWGDDFEAATARLLESSLSPSATAALTVGVLASDILLPVPSSLVSTIAGAKLGILTATVASWIGMTIGAAIGFGLARAFGRPLVERLAGREEIERLEPTSRSVGPKLLIMTRPLPVLAEAVVLLTGSMGLTWRQFLWPVALSNLGIALAYSIVGSLAREHGALVWAVVGSIVVPLCASLVVRGRLRR